MMEELKKSFSAILYERTTSPLFGTLIFSWCLWNWKIIYVTFFISENELCCNKIDYITYCCNNTNHLIWNPLLSTLILLTIIPFISNGTYWLSINFNKWKIDQKNKVELRQLLTVEQSIELREQIFNQEEKFSKLVEDKNTEIETLKLQLSTLSQSSKSVDNSEAEELLKLSERIKKNPSELSSFKFIINCIQSNYRIEATKDSSDVLILLEAYNLIDKSNSSLYKLTDTGKKFLKYFNEEKF